MTGQGFGQRKDRYGFYIFFVYMLYIFRKFSQALIIATAVIDTIIEKYMCIRSVLLQYMTVPHVRTSS